MTTTSEMLVAAPAPVAVPTIDEAALTRPTNVAEHMAAALVSNGLMTRAEINEGLAAEPPSPFSDGPFAHIEKAFQPPETAAGYRIPAFLPGVEYSLDLERSIRDAAHGAGLDQGFVADLVERGNRAALAPPKTAEQREWQKNITRAELSRAWGVNYEKNMAMTQRFVAGIVQKSPAAGILLDQNGLGDDPAVIRLFHTRAMARKGA